MLTLHLNADTTGSLHLWAEDLREWNHMRDDGDGAFHPFSATGEALCEAMVGHFPHVDLRDFCTDRLDLMLPSASDAPLPSPAMAVDDEPPAWEGFDVWTVPTLAARGPVLVDLMDALSERPLELRFGETISYWRSVHALAEQLAAEGHVLPAVRTTGARPAAWWQARPSTSEHFSNLRLLREAIPPVARAVVRRTEPDSTFADHDLVVTTYGVARNDIDELNRFRWHRVVLDEAQKIKNSSAKRTRAIRTLRANHRLALTGTPVENRLTELWSIMEFLNPGLLGDKKSFRRRIARPIEFNGDERAARLLRRLTGPFILRRHKTDETIIDDLPEKVEIKEQCHLTEEQVTLYKAATDAAMDVIQTADGMSRRGQILKLIQNLKQICNHPRQYESQGPIRGRSGKLERLEQLAEDILDAGDRALVFTQSPPMAHMIDRRLRERFGITPLVLDGSTPQKKRDEMVELFQSEDGPAFFLLSLRAAGTGLNLTAANHVIHYDRWWNPAVEDQATDRTFRIGQTEDVQVRKLICRGTIEDAIDRTIERKRQLADQVLTDGDDWLTELDTDELRDLVTLSEERLEQTTARETTD